MKIVYVLAVLAVLAVSASEARKNRGCRYSKKAKWSDCDPVTKTKTRTLQPKPNNQPDCNTPRVQTRSCSVCQYGPPELGPCDPVNRTMEIRKPLIQGTQDQDCEAFKIKVKRCKPHKVKLNCQYGKRVLGDCDMATNTMVISFPLLPGQDPMCPQKNKTKACRKMKNKVKCKYDKSRSDWDTSACPEGSATRVLTLKTNQDETLCPPTKEVTVPCRKHEKKMKRKTKKEKKKLRKQRRRQNRKNAGPGCKYSHGDWSDCDMTSDTMSKTMTLISGDDQQCEQTVIVKAKCRKSCKYNRGQWGECDPGTKLKERVDTLKTSVSKDFCEATRKVHKKCGKKAKKSKRGCVYDSGPWSDCNVLSGQRTKTKTLVSGDTKKCRVEKTVSRPCAGPKGQDRCFFGPWQDWEECRNGVQRKQREVLQGGDNCQRKSVKTRSCTEDS